MKRVARWPDSNALDAPAVAAADPLETTESFEYPLSLSLRPVIRG